MSTQAIRNRKKAVMAFPEEENFVVPKKGGYGTPDSIYLNVAAQDTANQNLPPDITKTGNAGDAPVPPPVGEPPITPDGVKTTLAPPLPTVAEVQAYNCDKLSLKMAELQSNSSLYLGSGDSVLITQYNQIFELVNALQQQKCSVAPPPPPPPQSDPTYSFPSWSSLSCDQAKAETEKLRVFINQTAWVDPANREKALLELETGLQAMTKACAVTPPPPTPIGTISGGVTEPVVPVVPISQLTNTMAKFGSPLGGGGGGGGASASTTTAKKDDYWWLWLLLAGGLLYLATRKKKKS